MTNVRAIKLCLFTNNVSLTYVWGATYEYTFCVLTVSVPKDAINKLKAADARKPKSGSRPVDKLFPQSASAEVHEDFDCMLNQTNIGHNNNKFYIIQVLKIGSNFYCWNRWGRVVSQLCRFTTKA